MPERTDGKPSRPVFTRRHSRVGQAVEEGGGDPQANACYLSSLSAASIARWNVGYA